MKRSVSLFLALAMVMSLALPASAEKDPNTYYMTVLANGATTTTVTVGSQVTVTLRMSKGSETSFELYYMECRVAFDTEHLEYVDKSNQPILVDFVSPKRGNAISSDGPIDRVEVMRANMTSGVTVGSEAALATFCVKATQLGMATIGLEQNYPSAYEVMDADSNVCQVDVSSTATVYIVPAAPTTPSGGSGQITGVDTTMQYKLADASVTAWSDCTGDTVTNLSAGDYYVRYKAEYPDGSDPLGAGAYKTVPVTATQSSSGDEGNGNGSGSGGGTTYTANINWDGGTPADGASGSITSNENGNITLPAAPTRDGYTFDGWEVDGRTYAAGATVNISGTTTIRATWTANNTSSGGNSGGNSNGNSGGNSNTGTNTGGNSGSNTGTNTGNNTGSNTGTATDTTTTPSTPVNDADSAGDNTATGDDTTGNDTATPDDGDVVDSSGSVNDAANPFEDVDEGSYYYEAVLWAVENGITEGTSDTTFSPDESCTRAQAVTFLWRTAGEPEPTLTEMPYVDVSPDDYYYKAVLWAIEMGITKGTSDTTFSPDDECTRAHIATFLWRYENQPETDAEHPFVDVTERDYYNDAVSWAAENDITNGTSATTFSPDMDCSRGQVVTFLYRAKDI
jgi:uncharacterized repeat protein (TIGR02543 family)